ETHLSGDDLEGLWRGADQVTSSFEPEAPEVLRRRAPGDAAIEPRKMMAAHARIARHVFERDVLAQARHDEGACALLDRTRRVEPEPLELRDGAEGERTPVLGRAWKR